MINDKHCAQKETIDVGNVLHIAFFIMDRAKYPGLFFLSNANPWASFKKRQIAKQEVDKKKKRNV
jgi:hypothetical protein